MKKVVFTLSESKKKIIVNLDNVLPIVNDGESDRMDIYTPFGRMSVDGTVEQFIEAYRMSQQTMDGTLITDLFEFL